MSAVIRLAVDGDAAAVAAIYAPFVDGNATSFEAEPPSADEMRRRIAETTEMYPWLVCDCDGVIAGYAYASWHRTRLASPGAGGGPGDFVFPFRAASPRV